MTEMTNDKPMPTWRNFAAWSAAGSVFCILAMWGGVSILDEDGIGAIFRSKEVVAKVSLAVISAMALVGFTSRKRPFDLRTFRNFLIANAVAIAACLVALWGFATLDRAGALGAIGASEWAAAATGSVLVFLAFFGTLATASAHTSVNIIDDEVAADTLRERARLILCGLAWMAGSGLLLVMLGLAGPGGVLSREAALAGAVVLSAVNIAAGIAAWRLSDELDRTLSNEAGNMAFYLIQVVGGGWAMLAHLRFVPAPAPLDWLTMFVVMMFAASFIAAGRRNLLKA
jgi:hypothetical protein